MAAAEPIVPKPVWTTSTFVLYVGGFTVLGASAGALAYLASRFGDAAFVGWTLLPLVVLSGFAYAVLGIAGFLAATTYFVVQWSGLDAIPFVFAADDGGGAEIRPWVAPLVYGIVGLFLVALGLAVRRRPEETAP